MTPLTNGLACAVFEYYLMLNDPSRSLGPFKVKVFLWLSFVVLAKSKIFENKASKLCYVLNRFKSLAFSTLNFPLIECTMQSGGLRLCTLYVRSDDDMNILVMLSKMLSQIGYCIAYVIILHS